MHEPKQQIHNKRFNTPKSQFFLSNRNKPIPATSKSLTIASQRLQEMSFMRHRPQQNVPEQKLQIFFNNAKKYNYMKQIIDKYFQQTKREKFYIRNQHNPEQNNVSKQYSTLIPRISKKGQGSPENKDKQRQFRSKVRMHINKRKINGLKDKQQKDQDLSFSNDHSRNIQNQLLNSTISQDSLSKSLSIASTKNNSTLPRIDQMFQDKGDQQQLQQLYHSISFVNQIVQSSKKQQKTTLFENQIYIVHMVFINEMPNHRLKSYKQKGEEILKRQLRAIRMGISCIWLQYKYSPTALVSPPIKPLKDLLFKVKRVDLDSKFYTLKPKNYYKKLLTNNNQQLIRVIRQFCEHMKKWQGKILNNKINTSNLFISKNQNIRLGQWGFSSFRETHTIQNHQFQNRIQPIIKSQKDWFVPPQYLAPQIMKAVLFNDETDLMSFGAASDIWSLGITIFQILTVIPVWITQKCNIHGKSTAPRRGILAVHEQDLNKILKKQQKLAYTCSKIIEQEHSDDNFNQSLINVMLKCLQFDPERRPTYSELAEMLK